MRTALPLLLILVLAACGSDEPAQPNDRDEQRFRDVDAMLDEAAAGDEAQAKGAAPEDATPSEEPSED